MRFSHVSEPARAFLVATIASNVDKTIWVLCPSVRAQDTLYETLVNWVPSAEFLPEAEFAAVDNVLPDPEIAAERLALLARIDSDTAPGVIVATRASLDQPVPKRGALQAASLHLERGAAVELESLLENLAKAAYERVAQVTTRGQFAVRGGIIDLYSWQAPLPARVELSVDTIESLREFDIDTQISVRDLREIDILLGTVGQSGDIAPTGRVGDYIDKNHLRIDIEPTERSDAQIQVSEGWIETGQEDFSGAFLAAATDAGELAMGDFVLAEAKRAQFIHRLNEWRAHKARIVIYFQTEGEIERFREIIEPAALQDVGLLLCTLDRGFCFPAANLVILSAAELFGRFAPHVRRRLHRA